MGTVCFTTRVVSKLAFLACLLSTGCQPNNIQKKSYKTELQTQDQDEYSADVSTTSSAKQTLNLDNPQTQLRLLNYKELKRTYEYITNLTIDSKFNHFDNKSGYDTGSNIRIDNTFTQILFNTTEQIAERFVNEKLSANYGCDATAINSCVDSFIRKFATRSFRSSPSQSALDELIGFFNKLVSEQNIAPRDAYKLLTQRILMDRQTIFRSEMGANSQQKKRSLTQFEIVEFLSYSLTGAPPNGDLFKFGLNNDFSSDVFKEQITALLHSDAAKQHLTEFFKQWLMANDLDEMVDTPSSFAKFDNEQLPKSLKGEFDAYVRQFVFTEKASFEQLLSSPKGVINRDTAPLYGKTSHSDAFEATKFTDGKRRGILTLASVMAAIAGRGDPVADRPVIRGLMIKERFLCESVGVPSGLDTASAAESVLPEHPNFEDYTVRHQLEVLMEQEESCQSCHIRFMPYGFVFSNYDALGRFQTKQRGQDIIARTDAKAPDGSSKTYNNALELIDDLESSQAVKQCFATQLARYISGEKESNFTNILSKLLFDSLENGDGSIISALIDTLSHHALYVREM